MTPVADAAPTRARAPAPTRTPATIPPEPALTASPARPGGPGRAYRRYPEIAGTVEYLHARDGAQTPLIEAQIAAFRAEYPGIRVETDDADRAMLRDRQVTALASGAPPNVMMIRADSLAYFADRDALLPLDDLIVRDAISEAWLLPDALKSATASGRVYGLPQTVGGADHLLYVNRGLLERIGLDPATEIRTWQDLDGLVEPARRFDLRVLDPARMAAGTTAHQVWTYANGGRYWDDDVQRIGWAEAPGQEAAAWLARFVKAQGLTYGPPDEDASRGPLQPDEWVAGRRLCCVNDAGWQFELQQQASTLRFSVFEFPANAARSSSTGQSPRTGGWVLVIPRAARHHEAAWEWVKHATLSESACETLARQGRPSPLAGCDASLPSSRPSRAVVTASLHQSVAIPASPLQPQLEQISRQMQADILRAQQPPSDALHASALLAQHLLDAWNGGRPRPAPAP